VNDKPENIGSCIDMCTHARCTAPPDSNMLEFVRYTNFVMIIIIIIALLP